MLLLHSTIWGDVPQLLPGGSLGVVVFFVLSGYLITTLLLQERERSRRIDLRAFYLRRAARLLPALLLLLPVYVIVFSRQLTPGALLVPVISTILYLSSFVQSIWGAMGNLGFTWSLSVEEHFYALWPPVLRWLLGAGRAERGDRRQGRAGLRARLRARPLAVAAVLVVLVIALATIARILLGASFRGREFAYYSTFTRMDGLGVGCLAALLGHRALTAFGERSRGGLPGIIVVSLSRLAGPAALGAIAWCYLNPDFTIGSNALNLYGLPLCAIATAVLILVAVQRPAGWLARMLSWRPLVHLGTISYGLYIWNLLPGQTFRVLVGRHPGPLGTIGCALIVLVVVELSFFGVERPLMRWARRRIAASDPGRGPTRRPSRVGLGRSLGLERGT